MRVIKPMVAIETEIDGDEVMKKIEYFTRKCYKSEGKASGRGRDAAEFVRKIFQTRKHRGIIEHYTVSVTFITDRGVSHEHVRHRMASYLQESTRYCDYYDYTGANAKGANAKGANAKGVASNGCTYVLPHWMTPEGAEWDEYIKDLRIMDAMYSSWRSKGHAPQESRYWLPCGLKTEYVCTMNLGSWHNFLKFAFFII